MLLDRTMETIDSTLNVMAERLSAYGDLADRFGPLLREQASVMDSLASGGLVTPDIDEARLAAGEPVLVGADYALWTKPLTDSAKRLATLLAEVLRLDDDVSRSLQAYLIDPVQIVRLARARIEGDWKFFENTSVQLGLPTSQCLLYISETISAPVLRVMVRDLGKPLSECSWEHGHCPVCGSSPTISTLTAKQTTDLDQLVGGGGKKQLHCSLCGHDWAFKRNACPACGNDENNTREIFTDDGRKSERIEACHACNTYHLSIDLRECIDRPDMDAVQMGLIHLDIHAQEQGLAPVTKTLWNTLDS